MRPVRFLVVLIPLIAACSEDDDLGLGVGSGERFTAAMNGANVRPVAVGTPATATASFSVREPAIGSSTSTVAYTISTTQLASVTAAHIHIGGAAVATGPILVTLFTNTQDTTISSGQLVSGTFTEANIGNGVSLDSLVSLMRSGNAFVDLHGRSSVLSTVRGQIVRNGETPPGDRFAAVSMTGAKERPTPVLTTASGSATFELENGNSVRYEVKVTNLTGARVVDIHTAVADSVGPIAVTLFSTTTPTGPVTGTIANGTFTSSNIQLPGVTLDSLLQLMRLGRTYVNVHTTANPGGEIRAQIDPVTVFP
jgi:hypothetical protein